MTDDLNLSYFLASWAQLGFTPAVLCRSAETLRTVSDVFLGSKVKWLGPPCKNIRIRYGAAPTGPPCSLPVLRAFEQLAADNPHRRATDAQNSRRVTRPSVLTCPTGGD